jgi:peptidoglycan/LPS O-acetylase OafA/YrhL
VVAVAAVTGLYAWLDAGERRVFVLNAGNSPLLPLSLFGLCGALAALSAHLRPRLVKPMLLAAAVLAMAFLLSRHSFGEIFSKPLGRYETVRTFLMEGAAGSAGAESPARMSKTIPYYNLRLILFPAILSLAVMLYAVLALVRPLLDRAARWLLRIGRRSLDVYILHLAILAIFVVAGGKRPLKETWQGDAVFLGVLAICYLWAWGRDAWSARRSSVRADSVDSAASGPPSATAPA